MGTDPDSTGERPERVRGDERHEPHRASFAGWDDVSSHLYRFERKIVRDLAWALTSRNVVGDPERERKGEVVDVPSSVRKRRRVIHRTRVILLIRACSRTKTRIDSFSIRPVARSSGRRPVALVGLDREPARKQQAGLLLRRARGVRRAVQSSARGGGGHHAQTSGAVAGRRPDGRPAQAGVSRRARDRPLGVQREILRRRRVLFFSVGRRACRT